MGVTTFVSPWDPRTLLTLTLPSLYRKVVTLVSRVLHPPTSKVTEITQELEGDPRSENVAQAREAEILYQTLENWPNTNAAGNLHERVRAGNCIYQHTAQVSASGYASVLRETEQRSALLLRDPSAAGLVGQN